MPIPNLLHPVPVTIQRRHDAKTFVDPNFREPVQQSARLADSIVQGQVKWFADEELMAGHGGIEQESDGYVLFRYVDLQAKSIVLTLNDRLIRLGTIDVDLYVVKFRHEGHWTDQGGPTLVKAFFRDRTPSRQNRGTL